jgi:hypothetical protein
MKIQFNGKNIEVNDIHSLNISGDKIIINGQTYNEKFPNEVKIYIYGNVGNLVAKIGSVNVEGDVTNGIECGGSVSCDSVTGSVKCGGSLNCYDIDGEVYAGGSINANNIRNTRKR